MRISDQDRIQAAKQLLSERKYGEVFEAARQFSAESPLMPEMRRVASDALQKKRDEENIARIRALAAQPENSNGGSYIMGLKPCGHDSHICLVNERGEVVFDAEEERFLRVRHAANRPFNSMLSALINLRIHPHQVRQIAFSFSAPEYARSAELWEEYYRERGLPQNELKMVRVSKSLAESHWDKEKELLQLFPKAEVIHVKHHLAHSGGAFYSSPFERAAILSVDGRGEFETVTLARGNQEKIEGLATINSPHSLGTLYRIITYWIGLGARNEGKTMGLSSYGDPEVFYKTFRDEIITYDPSTGFFEINPGIINPDGLFIYDHCQFDRIFNVGEKLNTKDPQPVYAHIAAALQRVTEEVILALVQYLKQLTREDYLCISGGVALNSVANGKILQKGIFKDVSIHPAAHDGGTGVGAALYAFYNHQTEMRPCHPRWTMKHPYWGPKFSDKQICAAIEASGLPVRRHSDVARFGAECLARGKIAGWYQGAMEVGPRALGNRSILGDPRDPSMKDKINERVKFREPWRPFAPSVLKEDCAEYFDCGHESPNMLFVYNTHKHQFGNIPAVCHVDGTARVQTVDREVNPLYYRLIAEFKKLTGIGLVLNTSLNVRGEPIVCTPKEAIDCFLRGGMDCLILGDYVLQKEDLPGSVLLEQYKEASVLLNVPTRTGRLNGFTNVDVPGCQNCSDVLCDLALEGQFERSSVDLIHSHYYLQTLQVDRVRRVLQGWHIVLKRGGRLLLEVPDSGREVTGTEREKLSLQAENNNPAVWRHDEVARSNFTFESLQELLVSAGFSGIVRLGQSPFHPERVAVLTVEASADEKGTVPFLF